MKTSWVVVFVGAAASWAAAEPAAGFVQQTLRGKAGKPEEDEEGGRAGKGGPVGAEPAQALKSEEKEEHPNVIFHKDSHIPFIIQTCFACLWVAILGSLPFIVPLLDHRPVTKTQKSIGVALMVVLFGGVYLFCNIILFQSVHFEGLRPLTLVECIYLMAQVLTTVGYGDITPAKVRGQIFVGLYVIGALFIIAMLITETLDHVAKSAHKYREDLMKSMLTPRSGSRSTRSGETVNSSPAAVHELIAPPKPSAKPLMISLSAFVAIDISWVIFFSLWPGEEKTVFQALYMSIITLSSVGFGAFLPLTEEGMVYGAFAMLVGSAALVSSITNFCTLTQKMMEYERYNREHKQKIAWHLKDIAQGSDKLNQMQFLKFAILSQKFMTEGQFAQIGAAFQDLEPKDGLVDTQTVEDSLCEEPEIKAGK